MTHAFSCVVWTPVAAAALLDAAAATNTLLVVGNRLYDPADARDRYVAMLETYHAAYGAHRRG
jgi:hypothetical protein